jgi:hypothetical protein
MHRVLTATALAVVALQIAGCTLGGINVGGAIAPLNKIVYVADRLGKIAEFTMPVTLSSTPTYVTPTGITNPTALRFDGFLNLWAIDDVATSVNATGFTRPLTNSSTPFASVGYPSPSAPNALAFDVSGNLWVADGNTGKVYELAGPTFSGTISPAPVVTLSGLSGSDGLAFDAAGNLYVAASCGSGKIDIFTPPIMTGNSPAHTITGTDCPANIAFDAAGNLYIADFFKGIERKNTPTAGGGPVDITDTATTIGAPTDLAFDGAGNLYVADLDHPNLYVFPLATTPFSSSLGPSVTLTISGFAGSETSGVAVGPP